MYCQEDNKNSYFQASTLLLAYESRLRSTEPTLQVIEDLEKHILRLKQYPRTTHRDVLLNELTRFYYRARRKFLKQKYLGE